MRKISAHFILDGRGKSYNKGIVSIDDNGTVIDIQDTHGNLSEQAGVEFYSGILVPGFVNTHCHLELSHLKNQFDEDAGFVSFLRQVTRCRNNDPDKIFISAQNADHEMFINGIVAVGDISNETSVFKVKSESKINYYTFIEALGVVPDRAEIAFDRARSALHAAEQMGLKAGIVPHAPYSISKPLFEAIAAEAVKNNSILSIHSQESTEEDQLYRTGGGGIAKHLQENLLIDTSFFSPTGESALHSTLKFLPPENNLLLVHNLYTSQSDIDFICKLRMRDNTWFVLCPGSNRFIQNMLPNVDLFRENNLRICLGTDSLGSNRQLSILEEMKIIQHAFPHISLGELVSWSSFNGACALRIEDWAGSIEVGKRPGLNLLTGIDMNENKLKPASRVKKIG